MVRVSSRYRPRRFAGDRPLEGRSIVDWDTFGRMTDWRELFEQEAARFRDGEARLGDGSDERQRQLTRMGNAAYGAGLCLLMDGDPAAAEWLARAAATLRESYADAPPGSWGRPIGAIKALLLAGDRAGAEDAARWALAEGAAEVASPIGRYAAALACAVLGAWGELRLHADEIRQHDDFPRDVGDALAMISAEDVVGYVESVESVLRSFETREGYLEDVPVADTVLVLQALAADRAMAAELESPPLAAVASVSRGRTRRRGQRTRSSPGRGRGSPAVSVEGGPANARAAASALPPPVTR